MNEYKSVSYSLYELTHRTGRKRQGSLLRFEFEKSFGFADCHPWPEFGDLSLEQQLKLLSQNHLTELTSRSLFFAKIDSEGRASNINSLVGLEIPRSHFLVTDLATVGESKLTDLWDEGFREIKVKLGRDLKKELLQINSLFKTSKAFNLRFDFNGMPELLPLKEFLRSLDLSIFSQIEYIEDPLGASPQEWFELQDDLGVTFARDLVNVENSDAHYFVRVVKPAIQDVFALVAKEPNSVELVVTSYMDHPLGQVGAAYMAAMLNVRIPDRCLLPGLLHHHVYELNAFSELLNNRGPKFLPVVGTGFGFDELLAKQDWKAL